MVGCRPNRIAETTPMWPIRRKQKPNVTPCQASNPPLTSDWDNQTLAVPSAAQLTQPEKDALLCLARIAIQQSLAQGELDTPNDAYRSARLAAEKITGRFGGAFVTLWNGTTLRGCIGTFQPTTTIASTIAEVARSALDDPRFRDKPILPAEQPDLTVEISLLSDLMRTSDPLSLVLGTHGVLIRQGEQSGCFLPKVAVERGWSAEEFLSNCCSAKAELPADAWRDPASAVYLFTVQSFRSAPPRSHSEPPPKIEPVL
jgi:uncharacterized protein